MNAQNLYVSSFHCIFMTSLKPLIELLKIPSISTRHEGIDECAEKLKQLLDEAGCKTQIIQTKGHPVVFAEKKGMTDKTLLFYNHYDVQPPEPLDEWVSPPFEPTIRDNRLYARGAADDKGDIMARIEAVKSFDQLPITIKFVIDGEEEIGSPNLEEFFKTHKRILAADVCIWETWGKDELNNPRLGLGAKGILYVELRTKGPTKDLHSGTAAVVENPVWVLVRALSTLKDEKERILIDGFYDSVNPPGKEEIDIANKTPFNGDLLKQIAGIDKFLLNASDKQAVYRNYFEPTCNICGIHAGYTDEGVKTIVPAKAMVKLDFRLVPDQDPLTIFELLKTHLKSKRFDIEVELLGTMLPARTSIKDPFVTTARKAMATVYGTEPIIDITAAGSSPMWLAIDFLKIPTILVGVNDVYAFGHSPNESIDLDCYEQGIQTIKEIMKQLGNQ